MSKLNLSSINIISVVLLLSGVLFWQQGQTQEKAWQDFEFKSVTLEIGGKNRQVEFADTFALRAQGLQFRPELCEDCGMLFQFDRTRIVSMWMKNTLIPLDVAFITKSGKIIDIKQMKPLDLTSVPSSQPVFYALEMNEGWFAKNGIKEGDTMTIVAVSDKPEQESL